VTPDDQARRVDGLLASYGEMRATLERLDERAIGQADDIAAQREALREAMSRTQRMLEAIGATCEKHTQRVEKKVDDQAAKIEALTKAQRWTPTQWTAIITTGIAALGTLVGIVLTRVPT
jgi:hypothetical protein